MAQWLSKAAFLMIVGHLAFRPLGKGLHDIRMVSVQYSLLIQCSKPREL